MAERNKKLENILEESEKDSLDVFLSKNQKEEPAPVSAASGSKPRRVIFASILFIVGFFLLKDIGITSFNPVSMVFNSVPILNDQPGEDLLNRMNALMGEMGYTGLNHDELRDLRSQGVTATYISNVRDLGFTELTLDEAVALAQANVSSTFMAMMIELGYEPAIEDFIRLRRAGVTAHFTSNLHDLGYREVTPDQLIRMRRIGLTTELVEQVRSERGEDVPLEEIIRYRISNQ